MLKSLKLSMALIAILSIGTIFAANHPMPNTWGFTGEYLFLKPIIDDTGFVIVEPTGILTGQALGNIIDNDFDFKSGYSAGLAYGLCECGELQAKYTRISSKQSKTVTGPILGGTRGSALFLVGNFEQFNGSASSNLRLLHERLEIYYAQSALDCCGIDLYLRFGIEGAFLRLHEEAIYNSIITPTSFLNGVVNEQSRTWGVGPQIGFEIDYCLFGSLETLRKTLSLNFQTSGSLLVGQNRIRHRDFTDVFGVYTDVTRTPNTMLIPALHSRVGLKYEGCFFSYADFSLEVGYEFNSYFKGLSRITFPSGIPNKNFMSIYNFDLQGLYASAMLTF